jgi:hypothetical protein
MKYFYKLLYVFLLLTFQAQAQHTHSVARQWNEVMLQAIRGDFARPTVQARNLFHASIALYDGWAVYESTATTFLLGKTVGNYTCRFNGLSALNVSKKEAQQQAMSYAMYRVLIHRYKNSPKASEAITNFGTLMTNLGYNYNYTSTNYTTGNPAALGNYLGQQIINLGLIDGSNEANDYANQYYTPINPPFKPNEKGNPPMIDLNRWQQINLTTFIDQNGNEVGNIPAFLSPEWGQVTPFALKPEDKTVYERDNFEYWVYHDPGTPPQIASGGIHDMYKWAFTLVSVWASHLNPDDDKMWDISPASIGNIASYPTQVADYSTFYNLLEGGDTSQGYDLNPITGQPYQPQMVKRGDYARVLAEFWADGPNSETPPGHWFTILNYVNDHPQFIKKFKGQGEVIDDLEWDVKAYFLLGGAMHDAAITAWGIKGWYDYVRPISAIRAMADRGQSTDPNQSSYHPQGMPLIEGYVELVKLGDPLVGSNNENVGKIKLYTWKGHDYIPNPKVNYAGAGWILAEDWWSYQRPTFVTPPFAGYISGHSTFSRTAADVLTLLTGNEYFPGGMAEFHCVKNEYLVFEEGPSANLTLQWAKYKDASDQCSLSRIWGGIHPPIDDIPGRLIGMEIAQDAFILAEKYFEGQVENTPQDEIVKLYPNPAINLQTNLYVKEKMQIMVLDALGNIVQQNVVASHATLTFPHSGIYFIRMIGEQNNVVKKVVVR